MTAMDSAWEPELAKFLAELMAVQDETGKSMLEEKKSQ